jgi:hypothetical protein
MCTDMGCSSGKKSLLITRLVEADRLAAARSAPISSSAAPLQAVSTESPRPEALSNYPPAHGRTLPLTTRAVDSLGTPDHVVLPDAKNDPIVKQNIVVSRFAL